MSVSVERVQTAKIPSGSIWSITALHARYYGDAWGFDIRFEAEVARELAEFMLAFDPVRDGLWLVRGEGGVILGSLIIDRQVLGLDGGRVRWFILDSQARSAGLGRQMMNEGLAFCRDHGDKALYLKTFSGLDAARHLYESLGFVLTEETPDTDWNEAGIVHQTFRIAL